MKENLLPLFPLGSMLFPGGRMLLRIFEARYLDLVKDCMRRDTGFGVNLIMSGDEVVRNRGQALPTIHPCGVCARIVDWDGLPNNRLSIVIEGGQRYTVRETSVQADQLMLGDIDWIDAEPSTALPEAFQHLTYVLEALLEHPMISQLGLACDFDCAVSVGNLLAQLLPFPEAEKYKLLTLSAVPRLQLLSDLLEDMGNGKA